MKSPTLERGTTAPLPTNSGAYTVTIKIPESDPEYVGSIQRNFTIHKAAVTVAALSKRAEIGGAAPDLSSHVLGQDYTVSRLAGSDRLITPPAVPGSWDTALRLVMKSDLSEVPEGLRGISGLVTVESLKARMQTAITGIPEQNTVVYDIALLVSTDGGQTWTPATADNLPSSGLVVTLPYPTGTGQDTHRFTVVHIFTMDHGSRKAGDTERPAVENTAGEIRFTVNGLSPVSVDWAKIGGDTPSQPSNGDHDGDSSHNRPSYSIMVEKTPYGKITVTRSLPRSQTRPSSFAAAGRSAPPAHLPIWAAWVHGIMRP